MYCPKTLAASTLRSASRAAARQATIAKTNTVPAGYLRSYHYSTTPCGRSSRFWTGPLNRIAGNGDQHLKNTVKCFATVAKENLKRTPLHDLHASLGAKFVPFAGYDMPLQYEDLSHLESHRWTREKASLFDVSHMVQHRFKDGDFLMRVTPSALDTLSQNQSTLSCLLDENGGIVDDTVITRLGENDYYFVTNAGCRENDITFLNRELERYKNNGKRATESDWKILKGHALLALQGPLAASVLQPLILDKVEAGGDLSTLYFAQCRRLRLRLPNGTPSGTTSPELLVSRTGYTGEDGFEISIPPFKGENVSKRCATLVAKALLANDHVRMAGLAARDSLRLEAGMCLYGHDLNVETKPGAAGLGWIVPKDRRSGERANFNGAGEVIKQLESPKSMGQRRVGLRIEKGPPAREGAEIVDLETGESLGQVTSGLPSPTLDGQNIAMGYIKNGFHKSGTKVGTKVRNKVRKAEVVKMPFVPAKFYRNTAPA